MMATEITPDVDLAFCRSIVAKVFDRADKDLKNHRRPDRVADALWFLSTDWAAFLALQLGYSPNAPRLLAAYFRAEYADGQIAGVRM